MPKLAKTRGSKNTRASATLKAVEVGFSVHRPDAREVYLCGDFNEWSPTSLRMIRRAANGHWERRIALPPGRYQYKFVVDGEWIPDPEAPETVPNPHGSLNSVREVCQKASGLTGEFQSSP